MFDYDYTLEESGVEIEEKSNKQVSFYEPPKNSLKTEGRITWPLTINDKILENEGWSNATQVQF